MDSEILDELFLKERHLYVKLTEFENISIQLGEAVDRRERDALVAKQCGGSAPDFLAAFLRGRPLTREELDRVRRILDELEQDG